MKIKPLASCESGVQKKKKKRKHSRRDLHILDQYSYQRPNVALRFKKNIYLNFCSTHVVRQLFIVPLIPHLDHPPPFKGTHKYITKPQIRAFEQTT